MGDTTMSEKQRQLAYFCTAAAVALSLVGCMDRKPNRTPPASSVSSALARPSADSPKEPAALPAPSRRWGSELLPFADSSPECAELAARTTGMLAQIRDPFESSSPDESAGRLSAFRELIRQHTACVPTSRGSWAALFEGGADPRAWTWFVGFLPRAGTLAKHAGNFVDQVDQRANHQSYTGKADLFDGATYLGPYRLQVVSDYDGDGAPEAVVWTARIGQEVRSSARGMLWSFSQGTVIPYAKASKLSVAPFEVDAVASSEPSPLRDLDGDGRVDLLGYGPFFGVFKQGCGVIESFEALGPRLALHSLADGTFSERDAAAIAQTKISCPTRPTQVLTFGEHGLDQRATFSDLGCARLWSVPASTIDSEKKSACGAVQPASTNCDAPRKCSAEALAVLAAWSRQQPPFMLQ